MKVKKIYAIADIRTECHGQGDYCEESKIVRQGCYGMGGFYPVFEDRAMAQNYLNTTKSENYCDRKIVELRLISTI